MAIEKVKRVHILGFEEIKNSLLDKMQSAEVIHLEALESKAYPSSEPKLLKDIDKALAVLNECEEKKFLAGVFPEAMHLKKEVLRDFEGKDIQDVLKKVLEIVEKKETLTSEVNTLQERVNIFSQIRFVNTSLEALTSLKNFTLILAWRTLSRKRKLEQAKDIFIKRIACQGRKEIIVLLARKGQESMAADFLKKANLEILELPLRVWEEFPKATPQEVLDNLHTRVSITRKKIAQLDEKLKAFVAYKERLMLFYDYLLNESFKKTLSEQCVKTKRFFLIDGWILERREEEFLNLLKEFGDKLYVKLRVPRRNEVPPTKLSNNKVVTPFQVLVDMYGAPHPASLDPTAFLAPFFFLFVGICLSDAGYGAVLALISFYILKKKKLTYGAKNFFKLLCYLGISTTIVGIFLGSVLGLDLPFKPVDILNAPLPFLLFCFLLGYLQVLLGIALKIYIEFKDKAYQKGMLAVSWMGLLISLVIFLITKTVLFKIFSFVFVGGIIAFSSPSKNVFARLGVGLYELYGITKYFSDVLSYVRLFALGMSTGVIAMVINLLAGLVFKIPVIGFILAGAILLGGHTFNLLINLMSGFIHSLRLQFLEFFSKFFELGDKFFEPLKIKTKYVRLIDN